MTKKFSEMTPLGTTPDADAAIPILQGGQNYTCTREELLAALTNADIMDAWEGALGVPADGQLVSWDSDAEPTLIGPGTAGQVLTSNGAGAEPTFQDAWREIFKGADETRNTTTTFTDDGALVAPLAATTTYVFEIVGYYKIANATMDFKAAVAYSGTTSGDIALWAGRTAVDGASLLAYNPNALGVGVVHASGAAGIGYFIYRGVITTNAAGNLSLQWAQGVSDAGDLTVLKGATLRYRAVP